MTSKINLFSAVTTFNLEKHSYGVEMINSFFLNWPDQVKLTAFVENSSSIDDKFVKHKILIREYHEHIPKYKKFFDTYKGKKNLLMIFDLMSLDLPIKSML